MPVSLSIKNVPDDLAERLRQRAKRHHRSLQGELMAILEEAEGRLSVLDLRTGDESTKWIRELRNAR